MSNPQLIHRANENSSLYNTIKARNSKQNVYDYSSGDAARDPVSGNVSDEWSTGCRVHHPERIRGGGSKFLGEYCGVDYMFYHNLFSIVQGYKIYNRLNKTSDTYWPRLVPFPKGTFSRPYKVYGFESIKSKDVIGCFTPSNLILPADITYRATEVITLKPGFEVKPGSKFHGLVKSFVCGNNSTYNFIPKTQNDDEIDEIIDRIKLPQNSEAVSYHFQFNQHEENVLIEKDNLLVESVNSERKFKISPNPTSRFVTITTPKVFKNYKLIYKIFSNNGKILMEGNINKQKIEVAKLIEGVYYILYYSEDGKSIGVNKLIKI